MSAVWIEPGAAAAAAAATDSTPLLPDGRPPYPPTATAHGTHSASGSDYGTLPSLTLKTDQQASGSAVAAAGRAPLVSPLSSGVTGAHSGDDAVGGGEASLPDIQTLAPVSHLVGSAKKTFFNIIITIIGSGVLGLPYTFKRSGWLLDSLCVLLSCLLSLHCMLLLVACRKKLEEKGVRVSSYGAVGLHACGVVGQRAVDVLVLISQGGCCVAYLIFISQNLVSILCPTPSPTCISAAMVILLATPFQVLLSWVRSLTALVPFSIVADIANLLAMGLVIRADLQNYQDLSNLHAFTGIANIPFALGVACYCFEGFAMTLPLEASMKNPKRFPGILSLAMASTMVLYLTFGLVGYVVYKEETKEIITLNLPNDWSTIIVKLGLCLGLYLTFPVMMHPVHEILEENVAKTWVYQQCIRPHPSLNDALKKSVRTVVVVLSAVIAARVPAFAVFIALVGSSVCAMLAFVLPGLFHFFLSRGERWSSSKLLGDVGDIALIMFGLVFAAYGTTDALKNLWRR